MKNLATILLFIAIAVILVSLGHMLFTYLGDRVCDNNINCLYETR